MHKNVLTAILLLISEPVLSATYMYNFLWVPVNPLNHAEGSPVVVDDYSESSYSTVTINPVGGQNRLVLSECWGKRRAHMGGHLARSQPGLSYQRDGKKQLKVWNIIYNLMIPAGYHLIMEAMYRVIPPVYPRKTINGQIQILQNVCLPALYFNGMIMKLRLNQQE